MPYISCHDDAMMQLRILSSFVNVAAYLCHTLCLYYYFRFLFNCPVFPEITPG